MNRIKHVLYDLVTGHQGGKREEQVWLAGSKLAKLREDKNGFEHTTCAWT